ncbi:MAG: hypothetical protein A2X61_08000 [Ignavibacteria bacterium GWB2_35_12]|nr:MAG: hypothetical protein A2X63_08030 [Ignavibacteria bacterium GWA2_35_8]OGU39525.1 MAG: hypothetical protein A2X61_08000 [Ignavibacteria bacterium GWB2_35_12]OGU96760.1 MAG: hypothetical protein A2220_14030 [Ignavibacteria bacterium RIFOXYA2_FULL_35_10]OGV21862.1 MAG: hypothetical protein A2475_09560 [Ignavibacteria bacterium RIFOXYC2_FULL_35_21]
MDVTLPLYATVGTVYLIDTSGLIKLESTFPPDDSTFEGLWEEIDYLISLQCFRIIDYVEEEINSYEGARDYLKRWISKKKKLLVYETTIDCYNAAIPIINAEYNTGFFDSKKQAEGKEEADPYLIAYCKINNCTLITNESKIKPNKIPSVSQKNGVRCIDVYEFLKERGLKMERKK